MKKRTDEEKLLVGSIATIKLLQKLKVELGGDMTLDSALSFIIIARSEVCKTLLSNREFLSELQPRTSVSDLKIFSELSKTSFRTDLVTLQELPKDDLFEYLSVELTSRGRRVAKRLFKKVLRVVGKIKG